jgi:hypothetical protein
LSDSPATLASVRFSFATIAAVVLVIACPGAADASSSVRFGIQDDAWLAFGPGTLDSRLKTLDQLGVKLVRYTIRWDEVAPTRPDQPKWSGDPAYRWGSSDAVLKALRAHGIDVVLELRFTPGWANGDTGRNGIPTDGDDFANFATAVQNRFPWVRDWLIWNEPNKPLFLKPLSAEQYVKRILNPAYTALHAANKSVRVAGGITGPRAGPGGVSPIDWIHQMKAAGAKLDVYAHNPYPEQPQKETPTSGACKKCPSITMASLEKLQVEVQRAWPGKHMWLTEYGYQTNPPDKKLGVSYALQAKYIGEAALRVYRAARVDMLIHFIVRDEPNLDAWQSGFMTTSGKKKPSYDAYRFPLTVASRKGTRTTLWGQIRPGSGKRSYRLEVFSGRWRPLGGTAKTNTGGYFTRTVTVPKKARVRVYSVRDRSYSPPLQLS